MTDHKWQCARLFYYSRKLEYIKYDEKKKQFYILAEGCTGDVEVMTIQYCPFCGVELEPPESEDK